MIVAPLMVVRPTVRLNDLPVEVELLMKAMLFEEGPMITCAAALHDVDPGLQ